MPSIAISQSYDEVTGKGASRIPFSAVEIGRATEYAAEDADFALSVHAVLFEKISADEKLKYVYEKIEMPTMPVLLLEYRGLAKLKSTYTDKLPRKESMSEWMVAAIEGGAALAYSGLGRAMMSPKN